jgi:rubrerythrin|tara:strand:+ start:321 stop:485 length:165 start_codon:yes stop_codon:yes gene_type:complete
MFFLAKELGMTIKELTSKLTQEELIHWVAFFELRKEIEEKAVQDSKNKSRARKP